MAKATAQQTLIGVTLELSIEEAQALRDVLQLVAGSPRNSRRSLTDNIETALDDLLFLCRDIKDLTGEVRFKDR